MIANQSRGRQLRQRAGLQTRAELVRFQPPSPFSNTAANPCAASRCAPTASHHPVASLLFRRKFGRHGRTYSDSADRPYWESNRVNVCPSIAQTSKEPSRGVKPGTYFRRIPALGCVVDPVRDDAVGPAQACWSNCGTRKPGTSSTRQNGLTDRRDGHPFENAALPCGSIRQGRSAETVSHGMEPRPLRVAQPGLSVQAPSAPPRAGAASSNDSAPRSAQQCADLHFRLVRPASFLPRDRWFVSWQKNLPWTRPTTEINSVDSRCQTQV